MFKKIMGLLGAKKTQGQDDDNAKAQKKEAVTPKVDAPEHPLPNALEEEAGVVASSPVETEGKEVSLANEKFTESELENDGDVVEEPLDNEQIEAVEEGIAADLPLENRMPDLADAFPSEEAPQIEQIEQIEETPQIEEAPQIEDGFPGDFPEVIQVENIVEDAGAENMGVEEIHSAALEENAENPAPVEEVVETEDPVVLDVQSPESPAPYEAMEPNAFEQQEVQEIPNDVPGDAASALPSLYATEDFLAQARQDLEEDMGSHPSEEKSLPVFPPQIPVLAGASQADLRDAVQWNNEAVGSKKNGDLARALSGYSRAVEINPQYAVAFYNRAILEQEEGHLEQALADYTKAISLSPQAEFYNNRGNVYNELQMLQEALSDYNRAIELSQNYADAYHNRAHAHAKMNHIENSIDDFKRALELNPDLSADYFNLACLFARKDEVDEAFIYLEKAFRKGYKKVDQIRSDEDLAKLRRTSAFEAMMACWNG